MTRKHFVSLAWNLRQSYPEPIPGNDRTDLGSDWYAGKVSGWEVATIAVADACAEHNGGFDRDRFLIAAGYIRRPDGSMYPMTPPR